MSTDNKDERWFYMDDFNSQYECRKMNDAEFRLAEQFMHEKKSNKNPNEYLATNQVSRADGWVVSNHETNDEQYLFFKSTDLVAQKEGQNPIFGAIHDIHVEPVVVEIRDGKLHGTKTEAINKLGISHAWPGITSARNSNDIEFEEATSATEILNIERYIRQGQILEKEIKETQEKAKELETNFQKIGDKLDKFSVRKMTQSEINSAQEWVSSKLNEDSDYFLNQNTVSNKNALVVRNDQTGKQVFVTHTLSIRQGDGGAEYGLPPGVNGMTIRAATIPLKDGYPDMSKEIDDGIAIMELPVESFPKEVSVGLFQDDVSDEEVLAVQKASTVEGIKSLMRKYQNNPQIEFLSHLSDENENSDEFDFFRELGDPENRFRARLAESDEVKEFEGQFNDKEPVKGKYSYAKSMFDADVFNKNPPYIIEDKVTGNQVFVAVSAYMELDVDFEGNTKDVSMLVKPVVSQIDDGKLLNTQTEGLKVLGLHDDSSLKEARYTGKELLQGNTPDEMLKTLSIKGIKEKIRNSQEVKAEVEPRYKEKRLEHRDTVTKPIVFSTHLTEEKEKMVGQIFELSDKIDALTQNKEDTLSLADAVARRELLEHKKELKQEKSERLKDLIVNPESFEITPEGNLEKFDNVEATNALYQAQDDEYIDLNTPSGAGFIARHEVEDPSKVEVLKEGETIERAIKIVNRPQDKRDGGFTVLYSIKGQNDDFTDVRRITAERYMANGQVIATISK